MSSRFARYSSIVAVALFALATFATLARAAEDDAETPAEAPAEAKAPRAKSKVDTAKRKQWEKDRAAFKKKLKAWKNAKKYRGCRYQSPQKFLVRSSFIKNNQVQPKAHNRAVRYRAENYGYIPGFNLEKYAGASVGEQVTGMRFMGLPIQIHERLEPALICVEKRIQKECKGDDEKYTAKGIGGLRVGNTYRGGEISNHLFGIAIDIDTGRNPCCGCVDPWPDHPLCKKPAKSIYERTALTKCWINSFEKYGFYWLGRDKLQDTMHFEFLGDPDKILP
ncbi:MAG: M15 family metallopeptidase [Polyangiaceae bacterium]|nr:M15 family metallopeptidase [Polyangiaceae bacterium]